MINSRVKPTPLFRHKQVAIYLFCFDAPNSRVWHHFTSVTFKAEKRSEMAPSLITFTKYTSNELN